MSKDEIVNEKVQKLIEWLEGNWFYTINGKVQGKANSELEYKGIGSKAVRLCHYKQKWKEELDRAKKESQKPHAKEINRYK